MNEGELTVTYMDIPGFPGYRSGSDGSVWSCRSRHYEAGNGRKGVKYILGDKWLMIKPHKGKGGYLGVQLYRDGKMYNRLVHRLVLESFVGPRPEGMECRHYPDDDKGNCRLDNLSWATKVVNQRDRVEHGTHCRGERQGSSKLTDKQAEVIIGRVDAGESMMKVAREFGVSRTVISRIANGRTYRHLRGANVRH